MSEDTNEFVEEMVLDVEAEEAEVKPKKAKKAKKVKVKKEKPSLPDGQVTLAEFVKGFAETYPEFSSRDGSWIRDRLRKGDFNDENGNPTTWVVQNEQNRWIVTDPDAFTVLLIQVIESKIKPEPKEVEVDGEEVL